MSDSQSWIEELTELRASGRPCAVVVVTGVRGSAPREVGARMIVCDGRLAWGTIGGGNLEKLALEHATEMLQTAEPRSESVVFPLSDKAGQCCGGEVTLFFESFPWSRRRIVIFGAGHVAQALGGLAPWLAADVQLIDPRCEEEIQPSLGPLRDRPFEVLFIDSPEEEVDAIPEDSLVLVMTHSHALDLEILLRALRRGTFPYLGLIGSDRKWLRFQKRLAERGIGADAIAGVRCPIGLTRASKDPRAIAISTAAELLQVMASLPASRGCPSSSS